MTDLSRRLFFQLGAAAVAAASLPPILKPDPVGAWTWCDGGTLPRADFPMLSAVVGTAYGGDAETIRLPNMDGGAPPGGIPIRAIIKVRPDDSLMPVGGVAFYLGETLPKARA